MKATGQLLADTTRMLAGTKPGQLLQKLRDRLRPQRASATSAALEHADRRRPEAMRPAPPPPPETRQERDQAPAGPATLPAPQQRPSALLGGAEAVSRPTSPALPIGSDPLSTAKPAPAPLPLPLPPSMPPASAARPLSGAELQVLANLGRRGAGLSDQERLLVDQFRKRLVADPRPLFDRCSLPAQARTALATLLSTRPAAALDVLAQHAPAERSFLADLAAAIGGGPTRSEDRTATPPAPAKPLALHDRAKAILQAASALLWRPRPTLEDPGPPLAATEFIAIGAGGRMALGDRPNRGGGFEPAAAVQEDKEPWHEAPLAPDQVSDLRALATRRAEELAVIEQRKQRDRGGRPTPKIPGSEPGRSR